MGKYPCEVFQITVSNLDYGNTYTRKCYSDTTLGWLLKRSTYFLPSNKKYFRVLHKRRTLFLSSSRKKTLLNLGIKNGDQVEIGGVLRPTQDNDGNDPSKKAA